MADGFELVDELRDAAARTDVEARALGDPPALVLLLHLHLAAAAEPERSAGEHLLPRGLGHDVRESDLYCMKWNPVVDATDFGAEAGDERLIVGATSARAHARGELSPDIRQQLQVPGNVHGAVIEQVRPGSSADNAGLQQGDVILEVNRHKVSSPADVQQELSKVAAGQDALLLVWSNGGNSFRVLHYPEGA